MITTILIIFSLAVPIAGYYLGLRRGRTQTISFFVERLHSTISVNYGEAVLVYNPTTDNIMYATFKGYNDKNQIVLGEKWFDNWYQYGDTVVEPGAVIFYKVPKQLVELSPNRATENILDIERIFIIKQNIPIFDK